MLDGVGPHAADGQGHRRALVEGVHPEPAEARDAVGEVGLVLLLEGLAARSAA